MRAALYDRRGPAREVLRTENIERPEPGPGQVRVRIALSGLNPTDAKIRGGATPQALDTFQIPHHDAAGVIDAVGPGVDADRVGQRVFTWLAAYGNRWGTAAEWCVLPQERAVPLAEGVGDDLAACLGVPALTAHRCLFADGRLNGGTVLVAGGAGAVGHYAIQLAKHAGARVISTVSGPGKAEQAAAAGADHVVNYRDPDAIDQVRGYAPTVDRIVEVALGANIDLDLAVSGPRTVISTYGAGDVTLPVRVCMTANVSLRFVLLYTMPQAAKEEAAHDIAAAAAGALTALPLHRFALSDAVAAHEAVEKGVVGKVVVDPGA